MLKRTRLVLADGTVIADASQAPRLALHAAELAFLHPITQQPLRFLSPWPIELTTLVTRLRDAAKDER